MTGTAMTSRRMVLGGLGGLSFMALQVAGCAASDAPVTVAGAPAPDVGPLLSALEQEAGGRLCVSILMPATGQASGWRAAEKVIMRSTMKLPVAGFILREIDQGKVRLDQMLPVAEADRQRLARDLGPLAPDAQVSVSSLLEVMLVNSNNPATDMLLGLMGGPAGFHERLAAMGDMTTRLDNLERAFSAAGRESTTPEVMASTVTKMLTPGFLSPASRTLLQDWMVGTVTGRRRLRAGFDPAWLAGDKTGTGTGAGVMNHINDVAVVWFSPSDFVVIAAYYEPAVRSADIRDEDQAVLARVGEIATGWIRQVRG